MLPARGLTEEGIAQFAVAAGLVFRAYSITTGGMIDPDSLCDDVLFPRSARRIRLLHFTEESAEWQWDGRL
jgi:hypothetical protein